MNQADRDRILQLVAYVKALYHSDYRKLAPMSDPLIRAHALCDDVVNSIAPRRDELSREDLEKLILLKDKFAIKQTENLGKAIDTICLLMGTRWTKDKPRREGWYWAERDMAGLPGVTMVFVTRITGDYTHVWDPNARKEHGVSDFDWWYGPLEPPYPNTAKGFCDAGSN